MHNIRRVVTNNCKTKTLLKKSQEKRFPKKTQVWNNYVPYHTRKNTNTFNQGYGQVKQPQYAPNSK
jgi:hypothetical protein